MGPPGAQVTAAALAASSTQAGGWLHTGGGRRGCPLMPHRSTARARAFAAEPPADLRGGALPVPCVQGPIGNVGPQGNQGIPGQDGKDGKDGEKGDTGEKGDAGFQDARERPGRRAPPPAAAGPALPSARASGGWKPDPPVRGAPSCSPTRPLSLTLLLPVTRRCSSQGRILVDLRAGQSHGRTSFQEMRGPARRVEPHDSDARLRGESQNVL